MILLSIILSLLIPCYGQAPGSNASTIILNAQTLTPVTSASGQVVGTPGSQRYFYWFVATYPGGNAGPFGPIQVSRAPDTLSVSNYVMVNWTGVVGATSYDVLRTTVPTLPQGTASLAVTTGLTVTTTNDQSNSLSNYTVAIASPATTTIGIDNINYNLPTIANGTGLITPALRGNGVPTLGCVIGWEYFQMNAVAGNNKWLCTSNNIWTQQTGSGGGGGLVDPGSNGIVVRTALNTTIARSVVASNGIIITNGTGVAGNIQVASDTAVILARATNQAGTDNYCRSTTSNDTYTCTLIPTLTLYDRGSCFNLDPDTANTTTATLAIDGLAALSILNRAGGALSTGDITANRIIQVCYNGTSLNIQGDGGGTSTPAFAANLGNWFPFQGAGAASLAILAANETIFYEITVPMSMTVGTLGWYIVTNDAGKHIAWAIYDSTCTLIQQTATVTSTGANAPHTSALASQVSLVAGSTYFLAYTSDSAVYTWFNTDNSALMALILNQYAVKRQFNGTVSTGTTTLTFPGTCGARTGISREYPWVGFTF